MKKYTILALALALCITGLTGCRRNKQMADGTIPTTAVTSAPTTHPTTMPTTVPTTVPTTTEPRPNAATDATNSMTDPANPNTRGRSRSNMPGVG